MVAFGPLKLTALPLLVVCVILTLNVQVGHSDSDISKRSDDLGTLQTVLEDAIQRITNLEAQVQSQQTALDARGATYTRWGNAGCPTSAELVYSGIVGSGGLRSPGAPPNFLCLSPSPVYNAHVSVDTEANTVYGSEYDLGNTPEQETTPACAVCRIQRSTTLMIPGTNQCSPGWQVEYTGNIMAGWKGATGASDFICVDPKHDYLPGTQANEDQNVIHYVITGCGSLPCPPYQNGKVVSCVVCSK